MSAMSHEGEVAVGGEFVFLCGFFGYVTLAMLLDCGGEEEDIIHHQETVWGERKKKNLLLSQPVMLNRDVGEA